MPKLLSDGIQFRFAAREPCRERGRRFLRVLQLESDRLGAAARRLQLRFELRGRLRTRLERGNRLRMLALQRMQLGIALAE